MFQKLIINAIFRLIQSSLIEKISYAPLKNFAGNLVEPLKRFAEILTDKNPDNKQQFKEFWEQNKSSLISQNLDTAIQIIELEVQNEEIKFAVIELLTGIKEEQEGKLAA